MSAVTSLIEDQPARVSPAPAETLYQFNESPLLARQSPAQVDGHGVSGGVGGCAEQARKKCSGHRRGYFHG